MPAAGESAALPARPVVTLPGAAPVAAQPDAREVWAAFDKLGVPNAEIALLAQPLTPGAGVLISHNEKLMFTLASATKVVTTLASLQTLPSSFRWRTRAWLGGPLEGGMLQGDLILVGGGDATLNAKRLREWFGRLRKQGLTDIHGSIVLDQTLFRLNDQDHAHTPVPDNSRPHHARPDAFIVDEPQIRVQPILDDAQQVQVRFDPPLAGIELVNQLRLVPGKCGVQAEFQGSDGRPRVLLSGQWSPRCVTPIVMETGPSRALSAALVAGAWNAAEGKLSGQVLHKDPPAAVPAPRAAPGRRIRISRAPASPYPGKPWATLESPPLPELVRAINKDSNNLMARNLLLSIAPGFSPTTSTLQLARQRMGLWLKKLGVADDTIRMDNGSGLAHTEQGSVLAMVQLLQAAWNDARVQKTFMASLPVAGADGTLAARFKGSPAQRHAFLKTGTLTGVRSLAGYVRGQSGQMIAVAVVVNSEKAGGSAPALDKFIEWVRRNG